MASKDTEGFAGTDGERGFQTTHWSRVVQAADAGTQEAEIALGRLYRTYSYPLYAYIRRQGHDAEVARDTVQDLFHKILEKNQLSTVAPEKGRFRSYLLAAVNHLLANAWQRAQRVKRGGGQAAVPLDEAEAEQRYQADIADNRTPEKLYDRRWALALLDQVLKRLREEYATAGRETIFEALAVFLSGQEPEGGYGEVAKRLRLTEGALRVAVHRMRERYRDLLRAEVAETLETPGQVDEELRHLMAALRE